MKPSDGLPFFWAVGDSVAFVPPQTDVPRNGRVTSVAPAKEGSYLVGFDSVPDIATARALVGCFCLMPADAVPVQSVAEEGLKPSLEGFAVIDRRLGPLGRVEALVERPWQSLLAVTGDYGRFSIPDVAEFVKGIDTQARSVDVEIPDGLLGLAEPPAVGGPAAEQPQGEGDGRAD